MWSVDFTDAWALDGLRTWLETGRLVHDVSHVHDLPVLDQSVEEVALGRALAEQLRREKAITGVFDEGCMGMYNAIFDDELLNPLGIYKERLSQSALVAEMNRVSDDEAAAVKAWLDDAGLRFDFGTDEENELTPAQVMSQLKMYVAALRIADDFGLDAVGIQYQQGLKDVVPASDLAEGLLNNVQRPPVYPGMGPASCMPASRCRTSTRSTKGSPSTPSSPIGSGRRWASTRRPPCTTSAGARPTATSSCG